MNLEQIKEKFTSITEMDGIGINVYFLLKVNGQQLLKRANIKEEIKQSLIDSYKRSLNEIVINDDLTLLNLSEADDRRNAFYKYNLEETPSIFNFLDDIRNEELQPDFFSFENDSLTNLEGYFINFGDFENNILMYRKQMAVNLFKQGKIYLIKGHETQFDAIDKEFLRIDTKIDVVKINDTVYINNISILERHYEFTDIILNEATISLVSISNLDILDNIEVLNERVTDVTFARKLAKISTSSPVFLLPRDHIINFVKNHLVLATSFKYSQDDLKISLDTIKSQNSFLRLMNDDFLHSQLTAYDYVTPAKDKL